MSATRRVRDTYIRAREVDEDDRDVVIGHRSTCVALPSPVPVECVGVTALCCAVGTCSGPLG